ncbi:hypothetical protein J5N97_007503 [Dioscorea zingiberensis]|uniref:Uncharacterized protein n=1 Tax=Dioscorea zingiberensis TaxID=325984 RepID=A0A9D5HVJ6_9LILI|nr:hypothetical protein J5N97_007503 [Dioscorea zingiberensis]
MAKNRSSEKTWQPASQRISFSHDNHPRYEDNPLQAPIPTLDFDFSTSFEAPVPEPSSADELFSNGKILPLPIKSPVITPIKSIHDHHNYKKRPSLRVIMNNSDHELDSTQKLKPSETDKEGRTTDRRSFWRLGRSWSTGLNSMGSSIYSFRRSKSAGPDLGVKKNNKNMNISSSNNNNNNSTSPLLCHKGSSDSSSRRTYYYSGIKPWSQGNGVRIGPVLNVPYLSRGSNNPSSSSSCRSSNNPSIFGYLLCRCSNKGMEVREVPCSP